MHINKFCVIFNIEQHLIKKCFIGNHDTLTALTPTVKLILFYHFSKCKFNCLVENVYLRIEGILKTDSSKLISI